MTRAEMITEIRALSDLAADLAASLDYYGGLGEIGAHGRELMGASRVMLTWADGMEDESGD